MGVALERLGHNASDSQFSVEREGREGQGCRANWLNLEKTAPSNIPSHALAGSPRHQAKQRAFLVPGQSAAANNPCKL